MQPEVSINWFLAQALLCAGAWMSGRAVGRRSPGWSEMLIASLAALSVAWSIREPLTGVIVDLLPWGSWVYLEGTVIAPPVLLAAGALSAHPHHARTRWLGPALAIFGAAYFLFHGAWMLQPVPARDTLSTARYGAGFTTLQSRADSCAAAAMATAVRAEGIGLTVSEADMAELADLRVGYGATPARVLLGLQRALAGSGVEPTLLSLTPEEAAHVATPEAPVLAALRAGRTRRHMVVVYGRHAGGSVMLFNPAADAASPHSDLMPFDEFRRRYTGSAIVLMRSE